MVETFNDIKQAILTCHYCADTLPYPPKPIIQIHPDAKLLIAGQAPGKKTHDIGRPFDDLSGDRLRDWLGITKDEFYDEHQVAIVPMGFCFPGNTFHKNGPSAGKPSGDLPPRPECAIKWREAVLSQLANIELTIVLGAYAQAYHLDQSGNVTEQVKLWQYWLEQGKLVLPHPSPRNNRWLKQNPWFEAEVLPELKARVKALISKPVS
ncbi:MULTISPECIES: uracil-DNA glycosylase family protein [Marinomonas]|uniref:Uracil-DNA glycosylase family protein n=1 Tax=Marinomonas arctica TaxID=383750 RepID=A0A7H1J9K4_9GAMM|nr:MULTISPECIES: uracil-DNA glycosylase family protein [Marinomonas]QNT07170.1 uracil-DNA glycosylase family protein [Marinomonas arctica]GGN24331.1 IclR family transcriptional regulator [Marinomonas arctica]